MRRTSTNIATALMITIVLVTTGCRELSTDYGRTRGSYGNSSLNGFGALRESYANAGFRNRDVTRLTDRVQKTDVIVWTPRMLGAVDGRVTRWFERWLSRGGRTLVYVVPDSGSEADYWADASKLAPPAQRLEYRRRAARSINQRMLWRANRSNVQSNGWFLIEPLVLREPLGETDGPWSEEIAELPGDPPEIGIEYRLVPYNTKNPQPTAVFAPGNTGPTGPGAPQWSFPVETTPTTTKISYQSVLETESGLPLVAEVTSKNWGNSRILVVAGGSLLTNYAFTRPYNRALADRLIQASTPTGVATPTAGFLSSDWSQIPVSERQAGVPQATGMELLTVWPLSLVTMHGLMLGLVVCLTLLPIFGRPRRIRRPSESEFGHHLDAVAALMNKSGGERYARTRISEYFKRMHGETTGPWVLPDPAPTPVAVTAPGAHTLKPKQLSERRPGSRALPPTAEVAAETSAEPNHPSSTPSDEAER